MVPLYISAITELTLASSIRFYIGRNFIGMATYTIIACLGVVRKPLLSDTIRKHTRKTPEIVQV